MDNKDLRKEFTKKTGKPVEVKVKQGKEHLTLMVTADVKYPSWDYVVWLEQELLKFLN